MFVCARFFHGWEKTCSFDVIHLLKKEEGKVKMKRCKHLVSALLSAAIAVPYFGMASVSAATGVPIDEAHFPDPNFRAVVASATYDKDRNGYLSQTEIEHTWNLHCENSDIYSIKGVEYFTDIKGLWIKGNHISEMDLSSNKELVGIWCSFNDFTSLDFSDCPKLQWVYCFNCKLESINFRNNPEMAYIECNSNPNLKTLDLSQNPKLENLFCSKCGLTSLDLSNNPLLCELAVFYNNLTSIDVSKNTHLRRLDIWHNPKLGDVDVSNLPDLQYYNCAWTKMNNIDVSHNPELVELVCGYNKGKLKSLDTSHNPKLAYLAVECDVDLKALDLSNNPRLYYLLAFGLSSINKIDISKNSRLCKAYNEGVYVHETEKLGAVYSKTINYGGSEDPFDQLRHCVCFDDRVQIIANYNGTDVPDSVVNSNDFHSDSEQFATRADAILALYKQCGSPAVTGTSTFTDVPADAAYADAVAWGQKNLICFGYPKICDKTFCPDELISRQDFGLMTHRVADLYKLGTAFDYGRSDWFDDSNDIDFYAWGAFTWAIQWSIVPLKKGDNNCYPHGRMTLSEVKAGAAGVFDLDEGASYSQRVGGNFGESGGPPVAPRPDRPTTTSPGQPTPVTEKGTMPNVIGMYYADAEVRVHEELEAAGFRANIQYEWLDNTKKSLSMSIQKQEPAAGTKLDVNQKMVNVTIYIAKAVTTDEPTPAPVTSVPGQPTITTAPVQPTKAPVSGQEPSIADFVERLYTIALDRESEPKGKEFWINDIESGNRTGGDCAHFFLIEAEEFLNRKLSDEDFVETLYKTFFDRDSEAAGKSFWVGKLKSGEMSKENVINGFIDSTEWCNVCATYGVRSGAPNAKAEFASKNAKDFATRLYTCCLDREPENVGLDYWSLALTNIEKTGCSAAEFFFRSKEFVDLNLKNEEYVRRLYTTFMGREPEAEEISYWAGEIAKGSQTKDSVLIFFGSSDEFTNICKKYGIDRGSI